MTQNGQFHPIPNFSNLLYQEWPILPDLQLFQSFPTEAVQNDSEWSISPDLQLFQAFPTKVAQNNLEWLTSSDSQLFQSSH